MQLIERKDFDHLIPALRRRGYSVIGPTVRDGAVVYAEIDSTEDLPAGVIDIQQGGHYRLEQRGDGALFSHVVGPHSAKQYLFPPQVRLWKLRRSSGRFEVEADPEAPPQRALLGIRSCDLHAIAIQDRTFLGDTVTDPVYAAQRDCLFLVAVSCTRAGGTCFCVSMQTGPRVTFGYDLSLIEVLEQGRHYFIAEAGTDRGAEVLGEIPHREASEAERRSAEAGVKRAAGQMGRQMNTTGIKELLYRNQEHPRWDDVARRCLSCANCTLVCPTCFCSTVEDTSDLTGEHAERWRRWDSCFNLEHSYLHGGHVRGSIRSRYRQWLTHKLASWIDQFGTSGCVGCGRCITWCPVGIDLTEEVRAIREEDGEQ